MSGLDFVGVLLAAAGVSGILTASIKQAAGPLIAQLVLGLMLILASAAMLVWR
jgi:hypothetical protein